MSERLYLELNPAICRVRNSIYYISLASMIDDSVIASGEIINVDADAKSHYKAIKTILKNMKCETKSFYFVLVFWLITIGLLRTVSVYCYLIKYKAKQKHLLHLYVTNSELKEVLYS